MTKTCAPFSVRFGPALTEALARHCEQTGETRSQVVQQSVAQYLLAQSGQTLGSLAEAVLPPIAAAPPARKGRASHQKRYRDYVREKRRR